MEQQQIHVRSSLADVRLAAARIASKQPVPSGRQLAPCRPNLRVGSTFEVRKTWERGRPERRMASPTSSKSGYTSAESMPRKPRCSEVFTRLRTLPGTEPRTRRRPRARGRGVAPVPMDSIGICSPDCKRRSGTRGPAVGQITLLPRAPCEELMGLALNNRAAASKGRQQACSHHTSRRTATVKRE